MENQQVSKPCNRQTRLLFVSRGVRSRPLEEDSQTPSKVDTIPLLSPTMESELLKEPWVFPHAKPSPTKEEDAAPSSTWEENFQDLSGWCMDTFQGQCDFHIGESTSFKLSGTKYEGNGVLSSEEGVLQDLMSVTDEEKWNIKMNTAETNEHANNNCRSIQQPTTLQTSTMDTNISGLWSKPAKGSATTTSTTLWGKGNDTEINTPFNTKYPVGDLDLDDVCPTSVESVENRRDAWDVLRTVETTGSDTFDLLSYVCDDEIRSPEGSVSTDSSTISKVWLTNNRTTLTLPETSVKVKTEESWSTRRVGRTENPITSTITSSSIESPAVSTRRSERTRATASSKIDDNYRTVKRENRGKKRYIESDSDDNLSSVSHYRESREKNNEASRKSRMNKKAKETEMATKAIELEKDNRILKMKVEELEKLVTSMRSALLRSALKKEF